MEGEVCRQSAAIRSEWVWEERAALTAYGGGLFPTGDGQDLASQGSGGLGVAQNPVCAALHNRSFAEC